jgi:hypothetical protein
LDEKALSTHISLAFILISVAAFCLLQRIALVKKCIVHFNSGERRDADGNGVLDFRFVIDGFELSVRSAMGIRKIEGTNIVTITCVVVTSGTDKSAGCGAKNFADNSRLELVAFRVHVLVIFRPVFDHTDKTIAEVDVSQGVGTHGCDIFGVHVVGIVASSVDGGFNSGNTAVGRTIW